ncbi:DMT family transporter [Cellulosimicrobium cellulans]|uniref:DMT family transporter n=1 Tax=Cellulosimicrobium cellulans TaxID=1710 RepID=UPI002096998B|nr:DMT family transporter [Cellulosimicrobium cellulans]MCO7275141.1 DMT family transporter [Cellulosimicrobium cellulans]
MTAPETAAPSVVSAAPAGGPPAAAPAAASGRRGAALVVAAVAVTVVLWASAFIGVRAAGHDYDPGALALGRQLAGSIGLTVIVAVRWMRSGHRPVLPRGRVLVGVLAWGVGWFSLYNLALNAAERHLDAGTTALLVNVAPVLVAVLAGVLLGEGFPRRLLVGMAAAFAGVAVIAAATSSGERDVLGVALGLTAAVLYAAGATSQKRLLARVDALTMTWVGCLAGTAALLPFAPALAADAATAPSSSTWAVVLLGLGPTAVAFTTWGYALSRLGAGRAAATTYLVPPLVVVLSWLVLAEVPAVVTLAGGALCLAGVAVATLPGRPRRPGSVARG